MSMSFQECTWQLFVCETLSLIVVKVLLPRSVCYLVESGHQVLRCGLLTGLSVKSVGDTLEFEDQETARAARGG